VTASRQGTAPQFVASGCIVRARGRRAYHTADNRGVYRAGVRVVVTRSARDRSNFKSHARTEGLPSRGKRLRRV
jgi:hypothetical protein